LPSDILEPPLSEAGIMMRLPRIALPLTLSCFLLALIAPATFADDQPSLADQVDTFWHYGKIARYDLAAAAGDQIVASNPDPAALLEAFEAVSERHGDQIDAWMLRWRTLRPPTADQAKDDPLLTAQRTGMLQMKETAQKLTDLINAGYETRRSSPDFIQNTIIAMSKGERAYENNPTAAISPSRCWSTSSAIPTIANTTPPPGVPCAIWGARRSARCSPRRR